MRSKIRLFCLLLTMLMATSISSSARADDDYFDKFIKAMTSVLEVVTKWDDKIEQFKEQEVKKQLIRRLTRVRTDMDDLKKRKTDLMNNMLNGQLTGSKYEKDADDLKQAVKRLLSAMDKTRQAMGEQPSLDGVRIIEGIDQDLNDKFKFLAIASDRASRDKGKRLLTNALSKLTAARAKVNDAINTLRKRKGHSLE